MGFIWNDKNFLNRSVSALKIEFKIFLPMVLLAMFLWEVFIEKEISLFQLIVLSSLSAGVIFSLIDIFVQFPHPSIPETYHPYTKTAMYIIQFIAMCFGLYIFLSKVIYV